MHTLLENYNQNNLQIFVSLIRDLFFVKYEYCGTIKIIVISYTKV